MLFCSILQGRFTWVLFYSFLLHFTGILLYLARYSVSHHLISILIYSLLWNIHSVLSTSGLFCKFHFNVILFSKFYLISVLSESCLWARTFSKGTNVYHSRTNMYTLGTNMHPLWGKPFEKVPPQWQLYYVSFTSVLFYLVSFISFLSVQFHVTTFLL